MYHVWHVYVVVRRPRGEYVLFYINTFKLYLPRNLYLNTCACILEYVLKFAGRTYACWRTGRAAQGRLIRAKDVCDSGWL